MTTYSLDILLFLFGTSLLFHVQFHGFNPWISKILWGGNGNSPQYSCLENPMNRGPCQATVYFITKSQTWLARHGWSDLACTHIAFNSEGVLFHCLAFFDFYLVPLSSRVYRIETNLPWSVRWSLNTTVLSILRRQLSETTLEMLESFVLLLCGIGPHFE